MGKDLQTKNLLNCPDVFSDIGNVNLFMGEELICPEELEQMPTELIYKDNYGTMRHHYLDTRMKAKKHQTDIAVFCIENQSGVSNIMPVRDMGYLYSNYNEQVRKLQKEAEQKGSAPAVKGIADGQKLTPVISIVLYYGRDKWTGPEKLSDLLALPEEWKERLGPLVADHAVRIVSLAEQDEETRGKYKSDFRHIVDYLACAGDREQCRRYIWDKNREIRHPEEYLDMMAAFSSDRQFASIKENVLRRMEQGEESVTMYSIAEELESIGKEKGREEGIKEGIKEGVKKGIKEGIGLKSREIIQNMLSDDQPPELISKYTKEPLEYVYQIKREMPEFVSEKGFTWNEREAEEE